MTGHSDKGYIGGFRLREAMFLTLCTVLLVSTKIFFRLKLGIPGHSAIFLAFCLVLGRTLVPRGLSATLKVICIVRVSGSRRNSGLMSAKA